MQNSGSSELMEGFCQAADRLVPIRTPEKDSSTCIAWEAYDARQGNRHYFIKQLRPELAANQRLRDCFIKEYHLGRLINSPYFPRYVRLCDTPDELSVTMDYIDATTVEEQLTAKPHYFRSKQNFMRFAYQLLEALDDLHSRGILHLDLTPTNVLLTNRTENVRIIDLGYGCSGEWSTTMGMTKAFASPEQQGGEVDKICAASDIYSFGRLLQYIVRQGNLRLPRRLKAIIGKCVRDNIEERYDNVQQIIAEIDSYRRAPKGKILMYSVLSAAVTLLLILSSVLAYRFWYATEFSVDGFRYRVTDLERLDLAACGMTLSALQDSTLRIPDSVHYHGRTYSVNTIDEGAFEGCNSIRSIHLPQEMHEIGERAFFGCRALTSLHIPKNLNYIYAGAFAHCPSLESIEVSPGNAILYVQDSVLFARENSTLVQCPASRKGHYVIPDGTRQIYNRAFEGCHHLTQVDIPQGVYRIHSNAFADCRALRFVELPEGLAEISNSCFQDCDSLRRALIHEGPTSIGFFAFRYCRSLRSLTIPSSVIRIRDCAFEGCNQLDDVVNHSPIPQEINESVFTHYGTLHVPAESVAKYKSAPVWKNFRIVALAFE